MLGALHLYRSIVNQRLWQHGAAGLSTATGAFPHPASLVVSDTAPSATSLIPPHEVEEELPVVTATVRQESGSRVARRLRKSGFLPSNLYYLPGNNGIKLQLASNEASKLLRKYGRNGMQARLMQLKVLDEQGQVQATARVLPRAVHVNSRNMQLENIEFMFCPKDRLVTVEVPVVLWNEEAAVGVRKGAWLHRMRRTVPFKCFGWAVPPAIELDVRHMDVHDIIRMSDLPPLEGCSVAIKDKTLPVVRCTMKTGGGD